SPSNALSGLLGEKLPVGNNNAELQAVPVGLPCVSTDGNPPSSLSVSSPRLLLLQPVVVVGTPGLSKNVTVGEPSGGVSLKTRSPTQLWFTPQSVSFTVPSHTAPVSGSNLKFRSDTVPTPLTGMLIFTPAGTLSGNVTAGPV